MLPAILISTQSSVSISTLAETKDIAICDIAPNSTKTFSIPTITC